MALAERHGNPELETTCGEFALREFARAGILEIAESALRHEPLRREQAMQLTEAPLPFLLKLIELYRLSETAEGDARAQLYRPAVYFPLADTLEKLGSYEAKNRAAAFFSDMRPGLVPGAELSVIIDRWCGRFPLEGLLELLRDVLERPLPHFRLVAVGPSTKELKTAFSAFRRSGAELPWSEPSHETRRFFRMLAQAGVLSIEGGGDLAVLRAGAEAGFSVTMGQRIFSFRAEGAAANFVEGLIEFRQVDRDCGRGACWFPLPGAPLVHSPSSGIPICGRVRSGSAGAIGVSRMLPISQLLVCLAIARLVHPDLAGIRAPQSVFGRWGSDTARLFGANDWGYVGITEETSQVLGIPAWSRLFAEERR